MSSNASSMWTPEWGVGTEMMGTFPAKKPALDPQRFRKPAVDHQPMSYHMQMHGGTITDPETGEEYYVRLQAPPEPQGIQGWHHGIMEGEWADHERGTNFYFAKQETAPYQLQETSLPSYLLDAAGVTTARQELDSRAKYAQGPPIKKNSFPGLREYPNFYGDFTGFHQGTPAAAPAPLTGKEFTPLGMNGRTIPPIGGQQIQALPYEGQQTVQGYNDSHGRAIGPHRVLPGASTPLMDSMRQANEATAAAYSLTPLQTQRTETIQLEQLRPSNTAQPTDTSIRRDSIPSTFTTDRSQYIHGPRSRVDLMRQFRPPTQSTSFSSTRSTGSTRDYTTLQVTDPHIVAAGFHPMESLMLPTDTLPVSGMIHIASSASGAQPQTRPVDVVDPTVQIYLDTQPRTEPETSVRTQAAPYEGDSEEQEELYKTYTLRTEPETSIRQAFPPVDSATETAPELYKNYTVRTEPETSIRQEFPPVDSAAETAPALHKNYTMRTEPETSVRQEFQPVASATETGLRLFKTFRPRTEPQTSVRRVFQPTPTVMEPRVQGYRDAVSRIPGGRAGVSRRHFLTQPSVPVVNIQREQLARMPHGVYTGHVAEPHTPTQIQKPHQDRYEVQNHNQLYVTDTLVRGSLRVPLYDETAPDARYLLNTREQYVFPPVT